MDGELHEGESCECGCCCDEKLMKNICSMEEMNEFMVDAANEVWMKMFNEACEKEWKKMRGKEIAKHAANYVKMSIAGWEEKMKKMK